MSGDALEVALALVRAPAMRSVLRQRGLPEGVGELIELAAGEHSRLERIAAERGETPEQLLEAARFYVREILLHPGADAYRVLGVAPAANAAQIKLNHRHLQHWLHPDRRGNDWESAFATRINAAWSELRSPARRAAYDMRGPLDADGAATPPSTRRTLVNQWRPEARQERHGLGWLVVGASAACCAWLMVLVERQAAAPAPEWNPIGAEASSPPPDSLADSLRAALENADGLLQGGPAPDLLAPPRIPTGEYRDPLPIPGTAAAAHVQARASPTGLRSPASARARPVERPSAEHRAAYTEWVSDPRADVATRPAAAPRAAAAAVRPIAGKAPALAPSEMAPVADPEVLLERVGLLRRHGDELTRYLGGAPGPAPPIWRSVAVQDQAARLRTRLGNGRVRFGQPAWRISADRASMTLGAQRPGAPLELRAEFVWRDNLWLVDNLHTEDLQ